MTEINAQVAKNFTNERLAYDLNRIADDFRWLTPDERAARLREAADRLTANAPFPPNQVLVTLIDGRQVGILHGNVQIRSSMGGTWSLPIEHANKPHQPGSYYIGEW